jgi:hypothetical protein
MKIFKKIGLGIGLAAFLAVTLILIFQNRALAVVPPIQTSGTKNIQTYYDSCVDRILVNSGGGTWCQWFNDKIPDTTMLYGQANAYPVDTITGSNYQYSQETTSVRGVTATVPSRITILNGKNTAFGSLGDSNLTPVATAVYTARLSKEVYIAYSPGSGGDNRYVLLVAPQKNNQPPLILALVKKDAIYKDTSSIPNGDGVVYAYKINKEAVASNSGGSAIVPSVLKGSACNSGGDCANGLCQKDNGDCSNDPPPTSSCESNFVSPFAWVICPALDLADNIIQSVYGQVEGQLCFNTGKTSSTSGVVCQGQPNSLVDGVKGSWNIFKNIASALLVIAMLIMIISQAIGGGLFEAYTIRKMLPKLVAAVILMQLSFVLLKYAIDLSNDAGTAIGNIILAPFGGVDHMNLKDMVGNGVHIATGSSPGQAAFDVFATIAAIGGAIWAIPALPLLALYVITGVFVAFFVLIIRKLLIIMLVILAPLAFIAWVMPGMDRYWKMWRENLTKLLVMFPLIMAMLSAGRIVAFITSQAGDGASMFVPHLGIAHLGPVPIPYMASATGFADLVIIIGAYFAPYFLLPKTYSWGGQLLGQAGKAVENLTNKGAETPKKFLQEREKGYREERRRKSAERVAEQRRKGFAGVYFNKKKPWTLFSAPVDQFRAGHLDPTLGLPKSRRRGRNLAAFVKAGEEVSAEEAQNYGRVLDATLRGIAGTGAKIDKLKESYRKTRNGAERYAILQRIAQFKDVIALQELRAETDAGEWNANLDSLYDTFKGLDPEMVGGFFKTDAATGQRVMAVNHEVLAGMTSKGWVDFMVEAQREGRVGDAIAAYQEIMQSEQANRVDEGAHAVMQGLGVARPVAHAPQAPTAAGAATPGVANNPTARIPVANLDTPDTSGWTPREEAYAENTTRSEYNAYRTRIARQATDPANYPPLTPAEQQRFEQIRSAYPDW